MQNVKKSVLIQYSNEELLSYLRPNTKYTPDAISLVMEILKERGHIFSTQELESINSLLHQKSNRVKNAKVPLSRILLGITITYNIFLIIALVSLHYDPVGYLIYLLPIAWLINFLLVLVLRMFKIIKNVLQGNNIWLILFLSPIPAYVLVYCLFLFI